MPKINDIVSYGAQGVCKITGMTEKSFGDTVLEYYVLEPIYQHNSTIFVPVNNKKLVEKMRSVLTKEEITEMLHRISLEETVWIEDELLRRQHHQEIIAGGDRAALLSAIKALYLHKKEQLAKGKKLHQADERFFKEAEDLLYHEFALVQELDPTEVLPFIISQIEEQ